MIRFILGTMVGGFFGVITMCIFQVSGNQNKNK